MVTGASSASSNVSVVIPHFNDPGALKRAILSTTLQSHPPMEVIVVDDYSSEEHVTRARDVVGHFNNVKMIELSQNSGPGTARNVGWNAALGEFVAFLDADDVWHKDKLKYQIKVFRDSHETIMVGGGDERVLGLQEFNQQPLESSSVVVPLIRFLIHNPFSTSTIMVRRDAQPRFPEGQRLAEDYLLWISLAQEGKVARLIGSVAGAFKDPVGESGLSRHVWKMIAAESKIFGQLWRAGVLNIAQASLGFTIFLARAARRIIKYSIRRVRVKTQDA